MKLDPKKAHWIGELKIGIAVARFNPKITESLLAGALSSLKALGVQEKNISVESVPGAFELPLMAQFFAEGRHGMYSAVICLGAVIRGGTPHFDYVCSSAADGIMQVGLRNSLPVIFGLLTTDTLEQALERSRPVDAQEDQIARALHDGSNAPVMRNKGCEAAEAAVEMAISRRQMEQTGAV